MALGDKAKARQEAAEVAAWQAHRDRVRSYLARAQTFRGVTNAEAPTLVLPLGDDERALLVLPAVALIEPGRLPAHFMGGDSGFSFVVAGGTEDREPAAIDTGVVTVTDRRTVFAGSLHSRTWDYPAVIGYHSNLDPPWTAIAVTDRQKASGVRYERVHAEEFRFALALGMARCHHAEKSLVDDLERQLHEWDRERPRTLVFPAVGASSPAPTTVVTSGAGVAASSVTGQGPGTAPSPSSPGIGGATGGSSLPPPGWYPDPYRAARLRWWDGRAWTAHAAP